jgi:hypothetical protein
MTQRHYALTAQSFFLQCNTVYIATQHEIPKLVVSGVDLILPDATSKLIPPSASQAGVFSWSISASQKCVWLLQKKWHHSGKWCAPTFPKGMTG